MALRSLNIREETEVSAPPGSVWELFRDLEAWPRWNPLCLNASWTSGEPWQVGSTFRMRLRMAGFPVPFHVRIAEVNPPHHVVWDSTFLSVTGYRRFRFDSLGRGTRVTDHMTFTSPVLPLALFYPRPVIRTMSRRWLRALKTRTEADQPSS